MESVIETINDKIKSLEMEIIDFSSINNRCDSIVNECKNELVEHKRVLLVMQSDEFKELANKIK